MSQCVVPAGQPVSIEVSYSDPGLFIGVQIYDDSGSSPVAVGSVIPMSNWVGVSYRAKFTGAAGKWYLYQIAAYIDDTFAMIDENQPEGSGSFYFQQPPSSGGGSSLPGRTVTGFIQTQPRIVGFVKCS